MKTLNLNRNIRILRKYKGINQDTLAAAMGVSMQAVSKWESGYRALISRCCRS